MTSALLVPRLAGLAAAGVTLLGLASLAAGLARLSPWFDLATHFRPHYVIAGLAACAVLALAGWWRWALLAVVLLAWHATLVWPYVVAKRLPARAAANGQLCVFHANVLSSNRQIAALVELIRQVDADIVFLQEVNAEWVAGISELDAIYPHRLVVPRSDNFGIAAYSRRPGSALQRIDLTPASTPSIAVTAPVDGTAVRLLSSHPTAPVGATRSRQRNAQLAAIAALAATWPRHKLVIGDLNVSPWSPYFRDLVATAELRDSRREHGLAPTWPAAWSALGIPIDHALAGDGLALLAFETLRVAGSDHRAVVTQWQIQ